MTQNPANKPVIAVDIDDVLVPFAEGLVSHHNQTYGTKLRLEEVKHHNFGEYWGVSHEEYLRRAWKWMIDTHKSAMPVPGAVEAIKQLHQRYRIAVITFRSAPLKDITIGWLDRNLSGYVDEPVLLGDKEGTGAHIATKAEVCQRIGARTLIDDHLKPIIEASEAGIQGLLFGDYPWNQAKELPDKVRRVRNWQEVLEYFDGKAE
jgi:uncharacterized HAD superfamily protein